MKGKPFIATVCITRLLFTCAGLFLAIGCAVPSATHTEDAGIFGRRFSSPQDAVAALQLAASTGDTNALRDILGPGGEGLENPDRVQATNELKTFSSALAETNHLVHLSDTFVVLELGD